MGKGCPSAVHSLMAAMLSRMGSVWTSASLSSPPASQRRNIGAHCYICCIKHSPHFTGLPQYHTTCLLDRVLTLLMHLYQPQGTGDCKRMLSQCAWQATGQSMDCIEGGSLANLHSAN